MPPTRRDPRVSVTRERGWPGKLALLVGEGGPRVGAELLLAGLGGGLGDEALAGTRRIARVRH